MSTHEQVRGGISLDAQEERLRGYAQVAGLDLIDILREEGVSASKALSTRPRGAELVERIRGGAVAHVIALKLDRLFRNTVDALTQTQDWDRAGVALHLVDMGGQSLNTASAMGRVCLTMMAAFAEFERTLVSERTTAALAHKKAHRQAYSPTPFGFDRQGGRLVPNGGEQAVIGQMRTWRVEGRSYQWIADELNCREMWTKRRGEWYPSQVRYVLANPLYEGSA